MNRAILHLGSNLGDRIENLRKAREGLADRILLVKSSRIYMTEAWGHPEQDDFYNQALLIETECNPFELLSVCREIGQYFPEKKSIQWGPRFMDIDIIFFNDEVMTLSHLKIPHPRMHLRNFVLIPLLEIAPEWIHPVLNKSVEELYMESKDPLEVLLIEGN